MDQVNTTSDVNNIQSSGEEAHFDADPNGNAGEVGGGINQGIQMDTVSTVVSSEGNDEVQRFLESIPDREARGRRKTFFFDLGQSCSLETLLPIKESMEYLEVELNLGQMSSAKAKRTARDMEMVADGEGSIRFLSCIWAENGSLLDSNVWDVFPKLKVIMFTESSNSHPPVSKKITRKHWELNKKKIN